MTMLEEALRYASLGLRVFPLWEYGNEEGKVAGTPKIGKWPERATTEEGTIRRWWQTWPNAGIGLATGDAIGPAGRRLFVLDVDEHDPAASGSEALSALEDAHGALPDGPRTLTAGGGTHVFLWSTEEITNARGTLPPGIDVRGIGGFVVLPPSSHKSGGRHEAEIGYELGEVAIPDAPEWLVEILLDDGIVPETKPSENSNRSGRLLEGGTEVDTRPGTEWAERTTWASLLEPDGWQDAGDDQWTRPGKSIREGTSASTSSGSLVVFSTNAPIPANVPGTSYSKLGYLAETRFGGDFREAAKSIAAPRTTEEPFSKLIAGHSEPKADPVVFAPENPDEWEPPEPILDAGNPATFPLDVFPAWIRDQVRQAALEMQLDADLPAILALGALSAIAGGRVRIRVGGTYDEPTNLYLVVALPPGSGKSPVFRMMLEKPLGSFERALDEGGRSDRELAGLLRRSKEKALDKAISSGSEEEIKTAKTELDAYAEPVVPKLFVDDVTVEKLVEILGEQGGRLALVSAEGGLFDQMTGRYSDSGKANLDPYLQGWAGDTIRVDRVGRGEVRVHDPALTVALTVQPTVVERLAEKPDLRGRGLTARFMFSYPLDRVGKRDMMRETSYDPAIAAVYETELVKLAQALRGQAETIVLGLDDESYRLFRERKADHETRMRLGGDLYGMREWVTKAQSSTIRLAALLHIADFTGETRVPVETFRKALAVLDYWEDHARRVHELFTVDSERKIAELLLGLIRERVKPGEEFTITGRDGIGRAFKNTERGRPALLMAAAKELVGSHWIAPVEGQTNPYETGTGRKASVFVLSPRADELPPIDPDQAGGNAQSVDNYPGECHSVPSALETHREDISLSQYGYESEEAGTTVTRDTLDVPSVDNSRPKTNPFGIPS